MSRFGAEIQDEISAKIQLSPDDLNRQLRALAQVQGTLVPYTEPADKWGVERQRRRR